MSSIYREQLEAWLKGLDVKSQSVLDIGGSQLPVKDRVASWDVDDYKILDLEIPHKGNSPDIVCDLNINTNLSFTYFNIAFCLEVMEYIWNPLEALNNIKRLLWHGGILYITFPFVYPHHNPKGQDSLRYTRWGAEKLLNEAGFKVEEIIPRMASGGLANFYQTQRMRPCDGINHDEVGYIIKAIAT